MGPNGKPFNPTITLSVADEFTNSKAADFVEPLGSIIRFKAFISPKGEINSLTCSSLIAAGKLVMSTTLEVSVFVVEIPV
jgi:hypothetical protein